MIVPTLCVGMHPMTLRVTVAHGSRRVSSAERGASLAAFPRRAWERSMRTAPDQVGCQAASLSRLILIWLLIFLPHRGDPRSRTGARACRALARHRTPGARALGYLGPGGVPFFQVTRCKSETIGGRYRRNGYVHRKNRFAYKAAFAGKPGSYRVYAVHAMLKVRSRTRHLAVHGCPALISPLQCAPRP